MTFVTIRSYPENCAALFSVDLLLQLPAILYIGELDRHLKQAAAVRRVVHAARPALGFPRPVTITH